MSARVTVPILTNADNSYRARGDSTWPIPAPPTPVAGSFWANIGVGSYVLQRTWDGTNYNVRYAWLRFHAESYSPSDAIVTAARVKFVNSDRTNTSTPLVRLAGSTRRSLLPLHFCFDE